MGIIASFMKNMKLARIMRILGEPISAGERFQQMTAALVSGKSTRKDVARHDLFLLIQSDRELSQIMQTHNANISYVEEVYGNLMQFGAGQWVNGAFVAAAAVATNPSLNYLLQQAPPNSETQPNDWMRLSSEMLQFFSR